MPNHLIYNNVKALFLIVSLLLLFTLSFWQGAHSLFVILLALLAIIYQFYLTAKSTTSKWVLLFGSPLLVLILGLFNSDYIDIGVNEITRKLSLVIFPLLSLSKVSRVWIDRWNLIQKTIVYGCLFGVVLSYMTAIVYFYFIANLNLLYYTRLSFSVHTTFFSMYLYLAMLIVWYNKNLFGKYVRSFLLFAFSITTFMLLSRAAILCYGITLLIIFFSEGLSKSWSLKTWLKITVILFIVLSLIFQLPVVRNRVVKPFKALSQPSELESSSTNIRVMMWETAVGLIKEKPFFGHGSGATSKLIIDTNKKEEKQALVEKKLNNAHNQYLNDWISNGVLGFLVIPLVLLVPLFYKRNFNNKVYRFFIFMMMINMLFDSIWNSQAGVIFYSFMNVLLIVNNGAKRES